ncbi:MAG: glycosyltransferase [Deltaproteobacteria bacterium]|nr:glycosyltransferase [Deltaproteobacteria bacterium]
MNNILIDSHSHVLGVWVKAGDLFPLAISKLKQVDVVLDIGCGIRPQNFIIPQVHICCEPFEQYINILKTNVRDDTSRVYSFVNADWEKALELFPEKSVDTVFLVDIIEHLPKEKSLKLLKDTERIARTQIAVFTTLGFIPQHHPDGKDAWGLDGAEWQEHKSGWEPEDFGGEWDIVVSPDFHQYDNMGKKYDVPHGAIWAIKTLKPNILFSIIVPTYNQSQFLSYALDSLITQSYSNWEALVVNDGSTDNTAQIAQEYADRDSRIRLFHKTNGGVASALNEGLKHAVGEWICWLSSDDLFEADKLAVHLEAIGKCPETKFFYSHFSYLDDATGVKSEPDLWNPIPSLPFQVSRFFVGPYIHGNSVAVHRDVFNKVGCFNETFRSGQDYDMWLRISARFPSCYIDRRTCVTRWHSGQSTNAFPEAGFFDSARSAIEFINRTPFPEIFPLLNLSDPQQASAAIKEAIAIAVTPSALIHSCGPSAALLDRLAEWLGRCTDQGRKSIQSVVAATVDDLGVNKNIDLSMRETLMRLKDTVGLAYIRHDVLQEATQHAQRLRTLGAMSRAAALERYVHSVSGLKEPQFDSSRKKILFYYKGLQDADGTLAGTNAVMVGLARTVAVLCNSFDVHLTGDLVADVKRSDLVTVMPLPPENRRGDFLAGYETVIFATHINAFKESPKACGQRWFLHQHCWHIDPEAFPRLQEFDFVLALSERHRLALVTQGVPTSRIEVLPNAVDTKRFYPTDQTRNNHSIMFAGALVPHKGVHILIQAFVKVRQCLPDAELHIYGSAAMWHNDDEYESALRTLPLPGVSFHGEVPNNQMPDVYRQHGILCLPSKLESFGLVTIEAQACGCIPVVHETGGTADTLLNGLTGFLYAPNDPETLAEALLKAVKATELNPGMRDNARNYVSKHFDSTSQAKQFINVLNGQNEVEDTKVALELDIIPPEIINDEFYFLIKRLVVDDKINTILEIGSSAGGGSTEAFVQGIESKVRKPHLYCMEVSLPRYEALKQRYAAYPFVHCYNVSSVSRTAFPTEKEVTLFYKHIPTNLNTYPLEQVLGWLRHDVDYIATSGVPENGIQLIKQQHDISMFDMVLIDGSEFTGSAELELVYGARWLLLDDITTFKNYQNYQRLKNDPNYEIHHENRQLRNGYAVFRKREETLPIHFFTIVLNGMPFIKYHIDILKQLPFRWHWHIVEGVADLVHDTSWSKQLGGHIPDEYHRNGLSIDGTTEYLDQLKLLFPDQISIYRKPKGCFWEGKLEMVAAPVSTIHEECLLWQIDVDEYWTSEQIISARKLFVQNPEKTAAFYWCHFFVGRNLVVNSRNCYSQNPAMEWLRTWRYTPGCQWIAHEPPRLHRPLQQGSSIDLAAVNPFLHGETEIHGLVFQHFAYVLPEQLRFKESYYGYSGALSHWLRLQEQNNFPVYLRDYFPWVGDDTTVVPARDYGVIPLIISEEKQPSKPKIVVDAVFFQLMNTGIARLWFRLLTEWAKTDFSHSIVLLDRVGTAPKIEGIRTRTIPAYDYSATDKDRAMLQMVCDEEGADLFVSSYYTTPITTRSVFYAYDMIPENTQFFDLNNAPWREKHYGITHALAYIAISRYTAMDLARAYPPAVGKIAIAYPAVDTAVFKPASQPEIKSFTNKYGITKPYFLFIGQRQIYKNAKLLFEGFARLPGNRALEIVCVGGMPELETELERLVPGSTVHVLYLEDHELSVAYSGAVAFVYPSLYEGFGLPILESMACDCPVITCHNSSIPEVAGAAALYVASDLPDEMAASLQSIQQPGIREHLIKIGRRQVQKFSWSKMAREVQDALVKTYKIFECS